MILAASKDKQLILDILTRAFVDNKSVNYVINNDKQKEKRIRELMDYSFEICFTWGKVVMSDDRKAAALLLNPHNKKTNLKAIVLDIKLAFKAIGLKKVLKVLKREATIKKFHPETDFYYLWFMGVEVAEQGRGIGSNLLSEIIAESKKLNYPIYIETSTERNVPFYQKHGFKVYHTLNHGFELFMMRT